LVKYALTPRATEGSEKMREELDLKNKKQACHCYKKFTKAERKYKKNPKMHKRMTNKIPRKLPSSVVLTYLLKCGFGTPTVSCGHMENAPLAVQKYLLKAVKMMTVEQFILKEKTYCRC
jgi:hypothetical protein